MANKKAKGIRAKTRRKFKRNFRDKTTVNQMLKPIEVNDTVQIKINSAVHDGMPHSRMHGKVGKVIGFQGDCPIVQLKDGNKSKKIISHKIHMHLIKQIPKGEKNEEL